MNIVINLNKSSGITSHDAVTAVKKFFKVRKAGHAGTLDPVATGVLLVCLNEATKITGFLSQLDKEYIMTAKLGECTDTHDSEGRIIKRVSDFSVTEDEIKQVVQKFTGEIEQIPPMYSAMKVSGKPLYLFARKGIEVERKPRKVTVKAIDMVKFESPYLTLRISCSKGTYIRSLCRDIGDALGVGAYITELIRTKIGDFTIENSAEIDELSRKTAAFYSIDSALKHLPELKLEGANLKKAKNGNPVTIEQKIGTPEERNVFPLEFSASGNLFVKLKDPDGRLFGIGRYANDLIKIERLLHL
jgi:tRNA pseudouridine55 synthase